MAHYIHRNRGTCSFGVEFDLEDGVVHNVRFGGGCNGNLNGISSLVEGWRAEDVIARIKGVRCGGKPTSYPDQLALALEEALASGQ